jgi:hypothetical protein
VQWSSMIVIDYITILVPQVLGLPGVTGFHWNTMETTSSRSCSLYRGSRSKSGKYVT